MQSTIQIVHEKGCHVWIPKSPSFQMVYYYDLECWGREVGVP